MAKTETPPETPVNPGDTKFHGDEPVGGVHIEDQPMDPTPFDPGEGGPGGGSIGGGTGGTVEPGPVETGPPPLASNVSWIGPGVAVATIEGVTWSGITSDSRFWPSVMATTGDVVPDYVPPPAPTKAPTLDERLAGAEGRIAALEAALVAAGLMEPPEEEGDPEPEPPPEPDPGQGKEKS